MYGLSRDADLTFLVGNELIQVCFGQYQTIFHFENDVSVSLECNYSVNGTERDSKGLIDLLGHAIVEVVNNGDGSVVFVFSCGTVVKIDDSNNDAESYQIAAPGKNIIV